MTDRVAALWLGAVGVVLAIAYFPLVFNKFATYDDEGFYLTSIQRFLDRGSLYSHTRSAYGPFYYTVMGLFFKITGMHPTPFNGRLIVLALTSLSACIFGATVFRVSRSVSFGILAQFATFLALMRVAGNEPMHPASLILLLVSIEAYALACYAMKEHTAFLVVAGAAVGAITMCKINVGIFAAAAIVIGWVIGNRQFTKALRLLVGIAAVALPFALMLQRLYITMNVVFAFAVAISLLATMAALHADKISLPPKPLLIATAAALGAIVASAIWPLLHGTSPGQFIKGVITAPLKQADHLSILVSMQFLWPPVIVTMIGALYALTYRNKVDDDDTEERVPTIFGNTTLPHVLFAVAALWVFGLGLGARASQTGVAWGAWLPPIALLCALAFTSAAPPKVRLALRFLVPLAILQSLHAYPVAGSQQEWATAALFAPAAIGAAVGLERLRIWREAGRVAQGTVVVSLGLAFAMAFGMFPIAAWHDYRASTPLGLPGTHLIRVKTFEALTLRALTQEVKHDCDTFYSAPGFDSLYIFTGITPLTGQLSNHAGVLSPEEQRDVAASLAAAQAQGKRVCIVRDLTQIGGWLKSSYGTGPLGAALRPYARIVARAGKMYTVSVKGAAVPLRPPTKTN